MKTRPAAVALGALLLTPNLGSTASFDPAAYSRCRSFATGKQPAPKEAVQACLVPAEQGSIGAQYALGAILWNRGEKADATHWLEKAAQSGHPQASYLLSGIYMRSKDVLLRARGESLLRDSICAGYRPPQPSQVEWKPVNRSECVGANLQDFQGKWSAALEWIKPGLVASPAPSLRIEISASALRVFLRTKEDWNEVKPGQFSARQVGETMILTAMNDGWDLDGKWIESWTIHLLRLSDSDASLSYVRTVNNVFLPEGDEFRSFITAAAGKATRESN